MLTRSKFNSQLFRRLQEQGIIGKEEQVKLKIFHMVRHPIIKPQIKEALLSQLQSILLEESGADSHWLGLLSLIIAIRLDISLFKKEFRKQMKDKIQTLISSESIAKAVRKVINEVDSAMMAALISSQPV